jgi:4-hydroxy-2-oxoheptanedioate aldolase
MGVRAAELPRNPLKRAVESGVAQIGIFSSLASNYTVELLCGSGFDWILLDMEHSPNDLESLLSQLQAAAGYPTHPVVRVPSNDMVTIKRVLDVGVQTLLIPHISSRAEAEEAVSYTRYPPLGVRGVGGTTRATRFGRIKDYQKIAHTEICVMAMVESPEGLENLDAICAVEGVDGVFLGPGDLSVALGYQGNSAHPELLQRVEDAIRRIRKAGRIPGYLSGVEADVKRMTAAGALFCGVGMDAQLLVRSADTLREKF